MIFGMLIVPQNFGGSTVLKNYVSCLSSLWRFLTVCSKHILFDLSSRLASKDIIDSVLRHREVGRAKDLSAPQYITRRSTVLFSPRIRKVTEVGWLRLNMKHGDGSMRLRVRIISIQCCPFRANFETCALLMYRTFETCALLMYRTFELTVTSLHLNASKFPLSFRPSVSIFHLWVDLTDFH